MSPEADRILAAMLKWQRRWKDREGNYGGWRGVSDISGGLRIDKPTARLALQELADAGHILRRQFDNGVYWLAILPGSFP